MVTLVSDTPTLSPASHVTIEIVGTRARTDRAVAAVLPDLECAVRVYKSGGEFGYREAIHAIRFHDRNELGRFVFTAGLVPRIQTRLESLGCKVDVIDRRRFGKQYEVDNTVVVEAQGLDKQLIDAVLAEPRGQIEVRTHRDRLRYISLICSLYHEAQILIAVARKRDAWGIWRRLSEAVERPVDLAKTRNWKSTRPILVCTHAVLETCGPWQWQIVLLADVDEITASIDADGMLANTVVRGLSDRRMTTQRVYGFRRPGVSRKQPQEMVIEAFVGPTIFRADTTRAAVNVVVLDGETMRIRNTKDPLEWKRRAYWRNAERNDTIAAAAKAIASGDADQILGVSSAMFAPLLPDPDARRIAVLVESVEHGRQLQQRLPGWRLMTAIPGEREGGRKTSPRRTIITQARAAATRIRPDVLIRPLAARTPSECMDFPPPATATYWSLISPTRVIAGARERRHDG